MGAALSRARRDRARPPEPTPRRAAGPAILALSVAALAAWLVLARRATDGPSHGLPPPSTTIRAAPRPPRTEAPRATPTTHAPAALPPLPAMPAVPPRPPAVVRAAYRFAAEHPEVLERMPCFCGCERRGHRSNHDCFIAGRDVHGEPIWDRHGMT